MVNFIKQLEKALKITPKQEIILEADYKVNLYIKDKDDDWGRSQENVASFELDEFPGCCGIGVLTDLRVGDRFRKRGIASILTRIARSYAFEEGYSSLVATDLTNNYTWEIIEKDSRWTEVQRFKNKKTGNQLSTYITKLNKSTCPQSGVQ